MSVSKSKLHLNCLILTAVILILLPFLTGFDITRRITIEVDGQRKELRTNTAIPQQILKDAGVVRCKKCGRIWTEKDRNLVDDLPCDLGPVVFPTDAEQHTRATMTLTMFDALIRRFREELEASDADAAIMEHLKKMDDTVTALADSIRKKHLSVRAKKAFDGFVDIAGSLYTLPENGYDRLKRWVALFCMADTMLCGVMARCPRYAKQRAWWDLYALSDVWVDSWLESCPGQDEEGQKMYAFIWERIPEFRS